MTEPRTNLQQLTKKRGANKAQLTRQLQKADDTSKKDKLEETDIELLQSTIENIEEQIKLVRDLDEQILDLVEEENYERLFTEADDSLNSASLDTSGASNFHINAKPRRRPACVFCKENHIPNKCTTVTDPQQRKDIVFRNKLCLNCFGPNHRSNECWSKFSCRICSRKHHTSICGSPATSHFKASERAVKSTKEDVTHVKLTPTSGPVLLKTTKATVSTSNASATANILLDEGAQRTFITEDLARKLQINSEDCSIEHITLGAFGRDKSDVRAIKRTEITLKTNSGNIALQCLIVPKISSPIQNVVAPTLQRHKYLQKLKIAPLVESGCFDIDLLLGADHYWQIVEDHVVRGAGPTAVSSKLGYLLSGPSHLNNVTTMNTTIMKALADTMQLHLNDCLESGPAITNDILDILLRFRTHQIGLTSDIEKAFLNVNLADEDRQYTKFFWLQNADDPESDFEVYQFKSVLFGSTSSQFMLNAVIKTHLEAQSSQIANDLKNNIYIDNVLTGTENQKEAIKYYRDSKEIMKNAGFNLRSWATNNTTLRNLLNNDNAADKSTLVNVLGLRWNTSHDTLHYSDNISNKRHLGNTVTKREIVRYTSSIFDPLGFLSPVHIHAKAFIQQFWKSLAVVEKLNFGNDGLVRSADVRLKSGRTSRPISKLYPLELSTAEPEHHIDLLAGPENIAD
ncbi:uncharacterized protein LOC144341701, partial [Saccoglossus kowalevskii]